MLINVFLGLRDDCQRRVACFLKRREAFRGQLLLRRVRQWPAKKTRRTGKLLRASNSVKAPRMGHQCVTRGDVCGRAAEPRNDLFPRRGYIVVRRAFRARDWQMQELRKNRVDNKYRRPRWILFVTLVYGVLPPVAR